jgi:hypothetical protein
MILAVLCEAVCCPVEVAAIERLIELFGDAPIGLGNVQGNPPVAALDSVDQSVYQSERGDQRLREWNCLATGLLTG